MLNTNSLSLPQGLHGHGQMGPVSVSPMGNIDLFSNYSYSVSQCTEKKNSLEKKQNM